MKRWIIQLFIFTASSQVFAGAAISLNLGSGDPGLRVIFNGTNQYVIYIDENFKEFQKAGDDWLDDYPKGPVQVLADRNFGFKEMLLSSNKWNGDPVDLYPFDEETAFASDGDLVWRGEGKKYSFWPSKTQVFSTNADGIFLMSEDAYALARSRYSLATNEVFLGKIGPNIFYWETRDATRVYFRTSEAKSVSYFKLPKAVDQLFGVKLALSTNMDVGFCTVMRSSRWLGVFTVAPFHPAFVEVSFKDAKLLKGDP
jgi:hypothetical protein